MASLRRRGHQSVGSSRCEVVGVDYRCPAGRLGQLRANVDFPAPPGPSRQRFEVAPAGPRLRPRAHRDTWTDHCRSGASRVVRTLYPSRTWGRTLCMGRRRASFRFDRSASSHRATPEGWGLDLGWYPDVHPIVVLTIVVKHVSPPRSSISSGAGQSINRLVQGPPSQRTKSRSPRWGVRRGSIPRDRGRPMITASAAASGQSSRLSLPASSPHWNRRVSH